MALTAVKPEHPRIDMMLSSGSVRSVNAHTGFLLALEAARHSDRRGRSGCAGGRWWAVGPGAVAICALDRGPARGPVTKTRETMGEEELNKLWTAYQSVQAVAS